MSPAESLDAEALRLTLGASLIGNRVVVLAETTSTNDVVAQMAAEHEEGLVVIAERQTAGRGQYGRRWESAAGKGLWLSVLLRPGIAVADSALLTDLLARSIAETIAEQTGAAPRIKPPNDIYLGERKVAGVLVEMRAAPTCGYFASAGLGVNLNHALEDFPPELRAVAGSLAMCVGHAVDRFQFAVALLRRLDRAYLDLRRELSTA